MTGQNSNHYRSALSTILGRVGSTARTISVGLQPLGLLAGGALLDAANGGVALMAMGGTSIAASLLLGLSRTFREAESSIKGDGSRPSDPA